MTEKPVRYDCENIEGMILTVRGQRVIMDYRLAESYGVMTSALNQAVKRNIDRFPEDFAFQLTEEEFSRLISQFVISKKRGGRRKLPYVFTEHGAMMAANVLNSPQAVRMSVFVVRAFVKMREYVLNRVELKKRLAEIEKTLISHDAALRDVYQKIRPLLLPPPEPPKKHIGFNVKETRAKYIVKRKRKKR